MTTLRNRGRLGALALAAAAVLTSAASQVGADPGGPASPTTAPYLAPLWISQFGNGKYFASPVVAGDYGYIGDETGHLTKFPLGTGTAPSSEPGKFVATWSNDKCFNGIFSRPAVGNQRVFAGTIASQVCGHNDQTGEVIWRHAMPSGGWANGPLLVGDTLYVSGHNGDVIALDAYTNVPTGTRRWAVNVGGSDAQRPLLGSPIMLDGKLYVGTFDGRIMVITPPTSGAPATATQLYQVAPGGTINDVLATDGQHLYFSANYATAPSVGKVRVVSLNPKPAPGQSPLRWNVDTGLHPTYYGRIQAPAVVDGIVYVPTKTAIVYLKAADGTRATDHVADTSPHQPSTPAVVNGVAYVGGIQASGGAAGALQAFDAKTATKLYYSHTPTVANTVPTVAPNGTVLLGGGNGAQGPGTVWAYAPTVPRQNK